MEEGRIVKVSGPLVIAEGLKDSKMYEMVKVGKEGLMGEIIELRGELASVQVYEETAGLGPGDPVHSTGEPLSVELGPGLLTSIYDGVQRPLDIIMDRVGNFITRGVEEPALNRKTRWAFEPMAKKGDRVSPGDVLGTVQETAIIKHKVMVPPGIEGELEEIGSGEFTVEDTVATIKSDNEVHEIKMMQRWPVRRSRPYQEKLAPYVPLASGQRVIDTFFPIAKGGTACIPGPFGSGKCVTGETPVLLASGEIVSIGELYERFSVEKHLLYCDGGPAETIIESENLPSVVTLNGMRFDSVKPSLLYSSSAPQTIRITTRGGRRTETTGSHEFFVLRDDWAIGRSAASELRVGDRILVPRKIQIPGCNSSLNVFELLRNDPFVYICDENILNRFAGAIRRLAEEDRLLEVAQILGVSTVSLYNYAARRYFPPLATVKRLFDTLGIELEPPKTIKGKTSAKPVRVPEKVDEDLAEFLGLVLSDGTIDCDYVGLRNTDLAVLKRFAYLGAKLFGIECMVCEEGEDYRLSSRVLARLIARLLNTTPGKNKRRIGIPGTVMNSEETIVCAFLRGFFHGDGSISRRELYFPTISERLVLGLSFLLLRLGIIYRIEQRRANDSVSYRVAIPGRDYCRKFLELIKPLENAKRTVAAYKMVNSLTFSKLGIDSVHFSEPLAKLRETLEISSSQLNAERIYFGDYLKSGRIPTAKFRRLAQIISERAARAVLPKELKLMASNVQNLGLLLEDIYFDEVKEIVVENELKQVFDFTVPLTHNFVASFGWMVNSNTVVQHQFAKWADAEVIVFIGCGERGNEMTDVLMEFPQLTDPYTGEPLMKRTVLIANTSNMPVAAREASIYTGITIAEYFRDMGYNVSLSADSTSRWAEALREISGRLEEMPGEEGYPAYLGSRAAAFYERAGRVRCLGNDSREGSLTVVGSVSPPGGDLSEPVTQATLRIVKVFWGLEDRLAYMRHFPAINWLISYSLYLDRIEKYWGENVAPDFAELRNQAMSLLQREAELEEIVRLIGLESLSTGERLIMETAKSIREDFLQQNAFHEVDTFSSLKKQYLLLKLIMTFHHYAKKAVEAEVPISEILSLPVRERIARAKFIAEDKLEELGRIEEEIRAQVRV